MTIARYSVIGVMSGTSLDGVDLAYVSFKIDKNWNFTINHTKTFPYSKQWKLKLSRLISRNRQTLYEIDKEYTLYLSEIINSFIRKYDIKDIDAICSHGHTALHQPEKKITYQIGNLSSIAKLTNCNVVCDFRSQDVTLNGQGAPLVPIGDQLLFSEFDSCINLGGFANISMEVDNKRIAFDICPVNIVLNSYAKQMGFDYDKDGHIAKSGHINYELLEDLNKLEFYHQKAPKSLGLEWVERFVSPILKKYNLSVPDVLRTFVEHIAIQIVRVIDDNHKVLFTGGGVYNNFLLERIRSMKRFELIIPENNLVEFKEALIFGLLGVLKIRGEINCLSSVTGADHDHSSGVVHYP